MIAFFNVLIDFVFVAVVALAITLGGRYERRMALMYATATALGHVVQRLSDDHLSVPIFAAIDVGVLVGQLWLLWRTRPAWLLWSVGLQVLGLGIEAVQILGLFPSVWFYFHGMAVIAYLQLGCLAYAVLRGRIGPPFPLASVERPG